MRRTGLALRFRHFGFISGLASTCLALACSREPPPVGAVAATPEPPAQAAEQPAAAVERSPFWFEEGPGRVAIEARLRGDHQGTRAALSTLLSDANLDASDRAAASLLMGIEHLDADEFPEAADHLRRAMAPEITRLAPIRTRIAAALAGAHLATGDVDAARELLGGHSFTDARATLRAGDAARRADDPETAERHYRAALALAEDGTINEARVKLAQMLVARESSDERRREALALYDAVLLSAPIGTWGEHAREAEPGLASARPQESKTQRRARSRARELARLRDRKARREWKSLERDAKRWADRDKGLPGELRCEVEYLRGTAIFKQRDRPRARPVLEKAAQSCAKAQNADLEVKSRYQAARGRYAEGHYNRAARAFESLAADHAKHTYADDALLKAGEAWESAGDAGRARSVWQRSIDVHPDGDMVGEARRRILVAAFRDDAPGDVERRVAKWIPHAQGDEKARLHYFHGRALARLERGDEAEAAWLEALRLRPISYAGMQSLSRLREQGDAALDRGIEILERDAPWSTPLVAAGDVAAERAELCASLGLDDWAKEELDRGHVEGWPAVALLGRAGAWGAAQRKLANLGTGWRDVAPALSPGDDDAERTRRRAWELAHPRPFSQHIAAGEQTHQVPSLLTYAIMQTESRFEPWVTSWAGARGLVQLMPGTAADLARRAGLRVSDSDLYDPQINLNLGMLYLGRLANRFGGGDPGTSLAIPSYNAGPGSVDKWLSQRGDWDADLFVEAIPYDETRRYTRKVLGRWFAYRWLYGDGPAESRVPYLPLDLPSRAG